ncbi:nucleoside deaminase [Ferruginibacter paludis]|uniref:nucleoside deaminase n=1 Tax=Ferruginibacter paludis TaxID=1310417 RepID=UPI0025B5963C|nr:nucleoside deaminase [Ferruginibacter paludis]MDN3658427.1 nucleoside deaminase [Ferruginibacter paludis]
MTDEQYMQQALKEAHKAFDEGEVPVGAVIVMNDRIIARGYNQVEKLTDSTAHAEIIALTAAFNFLGSKYLPEAVLYVTVQPCLMCSGALYWSKIGRVVYGTEDEKNGYKRVAQDVSPFHPKTTVTGGILQNECAQLMKDFFKQRR